MQRTGEYFPSSVGQESAAMWRRGLTVCLNLAEVATTTVELAELGYMEAVLTWEIGSKVRYRSGC